jgi:hypothetical protein
VVLLRERVAAAGPPSRADADRFAGLLADLDHEEFVRREKAAEDMANMGSAAEALIRAQLRKGRPSAEVRRRLEEILGKIGKAEPTAEALRPLRAVEVLEQIGTAEARQVLAALAKGAGESRLTQEAKVAEARLGK